MRVADLGLDLRIVEILKKQGIEELYPPQADAIGPALLGENLVLAIPTASGKSLVAYLAILASVLRGGKALYIVPLRALAAEKYEALKDFEPLGIKVGISVGDYDSADPTLEKLDVIVATSERADSLLRHRTNWLQRLSVVVADEVHLINDADRGPTLEVTLAKLRQVNPQAQVLALSATIKNSQELARWLEAEHITSEWRPVPLKQGVYFDGLVHFTDQSVQEVKVREDDMSGLVTDVLASGGQALVFVNTRRSTEALAKSLAKDVRETLGGKELDHLNKLAEQMVRGQEEATSMAARLGKCIDGGVAFHHAGLTNDQRSLVEKEFKRGRVKCIVATPTLAQGVDTPARRVVIRDLNRFDVNMGLTPIPVMKSNRCVGGPVDPVTIPMAKPFSSQKTRMTSMNSWKTISSANPRRSNPSSGSSPPCGCTSSPTSRRAMWERRRISSRSSTARSSLSRAMSTQSEAKSSMSLIFSQKRSSSTGMMASSKPLSSESGRAICISTR